MDRQKSLRRLMALVLALLTATGAAWAQSVPKSTPAKEESAAVVVGTTTKVSGDFFTGLMSNNTSDIDVRTLVHGYAPAVWRDQWSFVTDKTVVRSLTTKAQRLVTTYTVTLNDGLLYNDGKTAITARDYAFSLLLQASPAFAALGAKADRLSYIDGYEAYHNGESAVFAGVRVLDDKTFAIDVKNTRLPYFYHLRYLNFYPYPIDVLAPGLKVAQSEGGSVLVDQNGKAVALPVDTLKATVAGENGYMSLPSLSSGPWKITAYDREKGEATFEKNAHYLGNYEGQKPSIEKLRLVPVYQDNMEAMLNSGDVTVIHKLSQGEIINRLMKDGSAAHQMYPRIGYGFLAFNREKGRPFAQASVRRALSCALDKEQFARDFTQGFGRVVYGCYGLGQWELMATDGTLRPGAMGVKSTDWGAAGESRLAKYPHSFEEANALLVKAGYRLNEQGKDFVLGQDKVRYRKVNGELQALTVRFLASENNRATELLKDQFALIEQNTGMQISVTDIDFNRLLDVYYGRERGTDYDFLFLASNFTSDPTVDLLDGVAQLGIVDRADRAAGEMQKLAQEMRKTEPLRFDKYLKNWQRFQEMYAENLPTLPLYSNYYFDFYNPALKGYQPDRYAHWPTAMLHATMP